jgi:hypothetical protein
MSTRIRSRITITLKLIKKLYRDSVIIVMRLSPSIQLINDEGQPLLLVLKSNYELK